ncbi:DUF1062 domain-containing protein [Nisaea acidiphila]|uniref:DUF1062 domain-containing protein n=1 Tax=Nisaea acidiphila TaxID=1862145 RepID=A0A9J7ARC6_9PROT|nr:DUF1062 domain-containing protein [Nisaea acidiphila]UUX49426.1 DUF1062 domain-containing protein [Nisaea acidiphila]
MSDILRARWTVIPAAAPEPQLHCRRCGTVTNFASGGKIRVNSNGKKLDAWLIYKCVACESTWNRPILERHPVGILEPAYLDALQRNERALVDRIAIDVADLRRRASRVEEFGRVRVAKLALAPTPVEPRALEIELCVPAPVSHRLDRLLCREIGISRTRIQSLFEDGSLRVEPGGTRVLRRPVRDRTRIGLSGVAIDPVRVLR